ncbi:MAG: D-alanine--D-alanine ligase [Oscillospiraceae bacterium]|nr:D-alanine--D-alanine ligase [Oscillospiraceae bacterium]
MSKIKVAVIFGGTSPEHDASLSSATNIIKNIPEDKYEVIAVGITKKGRWLYYPGDVSLLTTSRWESHPDCTPAVLSPDPIHNGFILLGEDSAIKKVDVIFPVLFGRNGTDGAIEGLCEMSGIPYVGSGIPASANCMDKDIANTILEANGIPTARRIIVSRPDLKRMDDISSEVASRLGFPVFVKPACGGSSLGVSKAYDAEGLSNGIKLAFAHDNKVIVEECLTGRELECAVFGSDKPLSSPVGEVTFDGDFYNYDAKYVLGSTKLIAPAEIDETSEKAIRNMAVKVFTALDCCGFAMTSFFLSPTGEITFGEINTLPRMSNISLYPRLMKELGITLPEILDKLISLALERAEITTD